MVKSRKKETEGLKIADLLFLCLNKWYWIVISVLVCLIAAYLYIRKTPPVYQRTAAVLIKEDTPRRVSSEFAELSGMGLQSKVYNEILTLQSPAIMSGVVKELGLDVVYQSDGFFYDKTLYGTNLPSLPYALPQKVRHSFLLPLHPPRLLRSQQNTSGTSYPLPENLRN